MTGGHFFKIDALPDEVAVTINDDLSLIGRQRGRITPVTRLHGPGVSARRLTLSRPGPADLSTLGVTESPRPVD